jgi:predicted transport protein
MTKEEAVRIWKEFCFLMERDSNSLEKELQKDVESIFVLLGWSREGEIAPQERIQHGAENCLIPDIIIKNNYKPIIAIELKRPCKYNPEKTKGQLSAYMRAKKLKFGIFIGEKLRFYYEALDDENPRKAFETDFSANNEEAVEFISLISKPFDENKIVEFCKESISKRKDEEVFEKLKSEIINGTFNSKIEEFFIELLQKEYDEQIVSKINNEIEVKISLKNPSVGNDELNVRSVTIKGVIDYIKELLPDIRVNKKPQKYYGIQKNGKNRNFIAIEKDTKILTLLLKLNPKSTDIEDGFAEKIIGGNFASFEKGLRVKIKNKADFGKAKPLIERAYKEN